jgi:hypothetical protein
MKKNGLGTVYQRGESWVIDYYVNCDRIRATVKDATKESQARAKLKERISQIHTFIRHEEQLGFDDLVKLIETTPRNYNDNCSCEAPKRIFQASSCCHDSTCRRCRLSKASA